MRRNQCIASTCKECPDLDYDDGIHTIILNNNGRNAEELPEDLVRFLQYTKRSLAESMEESEDPYIRRIQESIRHIKASREMGERYMTLQEMLQEERLQGKEEGRQEGRESLLFALLSDKVITVEQGAQKLGVEPEEFLERYRRFAESKS